MVIIKTHLNVFFGNGINCKSMWNQAIQKTTDLPTLPDSAESYPENKPTFLCSAERNMKSTRLWKRFSYHIECSSKYLPDCWTKFS